MLLHFVLGYKIINSIFYPKNKSLLANIKHKLKASQMRAVFAVNQKNKIFAEYELRDIKKPIGISEYHLLKMFPKKLQTSFPTVEELEAELNADRNK